MGEPPKRVRFWGMERVGAQVTGVHTKLLHSCMYDSDLKL